MEEKCLSARLKGLNVLTYSNIRARVLQAYRKPVSLPKRIKKRFVARQVNRIDRIYELVDTHVFGIIRDLPLPCEINKFYAEIIKLSGIPDYNDLMDKFSKFRRILRRIWMNYRLEVKKASEPREADRKAREFVGRALSIVRRLSKDLDRLKRLSVELRKLPCIDFNQPVVVVAGMPQVGKSTFVARISSAKPEISPFPFTTKNIIVGHLKRNYISLQIIDTPGILDRPISELNSIERKALIAIRFLPRLLIFLIDPRPDSYYSLSSQLNLLSSLQKMFKGKKIIVAINKIDSIGSERLKEVIDLTEKIFDGKIYTISSLKGYGIEQLLNDLFSIALGFQSS